ncbi:S1 family peptidase [Frateuria soli]|uniref:S1 family peptidase n=1 Tax=Frateuria soli TaxID=1542730 RepID=UPI001E3D58C7|nr:S1 family peptidase [Frateuria soli]UGB39727.1 S1 family peptidase [Frateuria soli]
MDSLGEATIVATQFAPPQPMTAHEVASSVRRWAVEKNICQALPQAVENAVLVGVDVAVFNEAQEAFLRTKGITSIVFNDADKKVLIYTRRKVTKTEAKHLPNYINGCEIEYPLGHVEDLSQIPATAQAATYAVVSSAGTLRYACGSSVSPGNTESAGTLGALVRDQAGGIFGLSNNHVTGSCSHSEPDLPILAPGVLDVGPGGLFPFTIGLHAAALPMHVGTQGNVNIFENQDAAIFRILDEARVSSMQRTFYDTPGQVEDPMVGMVVEKVGRTTEHTTGVIVGQELIPIRVGVNANSYGFQGQVYFANVFVIHGDQDIFSDGGDSGSLIVCRKIDGSRTSVGLLFAGGPDSSAPGHRKTLMLPLKPILDVLGVTLVHGHNV